MLQDRLEKQNLVISFIFVRVYYLTTVEWKDFLPGSFLSHLHYGSRNNDLSLVSGICIVAILSQWFSCLAQFHLRGRGWTNFSPLFNDWDDTGPPSTSTSRLWVTWNNYEWDLLWHREAVLSGLGDFSESVVFHVVSSVSFCAKTQNPKQVSLNPKAQLPQITSPANLLLDTRTRTNQEGWLSFSL